MLIVFDEYTNAMDLMPREYSESARRYTRGGLREGRKYGFSLVLSAQRAVGLRDEVTQLGRAVFHVKDATESRYALGQEGAEGLRDGYFMARFDAMQLTAAFEPTDEQIVSFLAERRVARLDPLPWLEGKVVEPTAEAPKISAPKNDVERLAEMIRGDWNPEMSGRQVAALLGKSYAGWWKDKTDEIITVLKNNQRMEGVV
jgi:DNA helicase HerA-like ATPase